MILDTCPPSTHERQHYTDEEKAEIEQWRQQAAKVSARE